MNNDESLDLLDMDDGTSMDSLPEAPVFAAPRPKKPWLLLGIGALIIILSTYIIIRMVGSDSASSIDVDLDAPAVVAESTSEAIVVPPMPQPAPQPGVPAPMPQPGQNGPVPPQPVAQPASAAPAPQPALVPAPSENVGSPVRVIEDRKPVTFNPDKETTKPAAKPAAKPAPKPATVKKRVAAANGSWFVQFGSYSTRAAAESAQQKFRNAHPALFQGKQFVILAAVLKDGSTTYRLRIAFATSAEANGFCRNAKSDGVDCYVAK